MLVPPSPPWPGYVVKAFIEHHSSGAWCVRSSGSPGRGAVYRQAQQCYQESLHRLPLREGDRKDTSCPTQCGRWWPRAVGCGPRGLPWRRRVVGANANSQLKPINPGQPTWFHSCSCCVLCCTHTCALTLARPTEGATQHVRPAEDTAQRHRDTRVALHCSGPSLAC